MTREAVDLETPASAATAMSVGTVESVSVSMVCLLSRAGVKTLYAAQRSSLDRALHDARHELLAGEHEQDEQRDDRQHRTREDQ